MKVPEVFIFVLVIVSMGMVGLAGAQDMLKKKSLMPSSKHGWMDGIYALLLAIFILMYNRL
jgi:hypothetical protein